MFDQEPTQEEMEQLEAEAEYVRRRDARMAKAMQDWADVLAATPARYREPLREIIFDMAKRQPDGQGIHAADGTSLPPGVLARLKQMQAAEEVEDDSAESFLEYSRKVGFVRAVVHYIDNDDYEKERDRWLRPNLLWGLLVQDHWFPCLAETLADPDPKWRAVAAKWASGWAPSKDAAVAALKPLLEDSAVTVRGWAALKLSAIDPEIEGAARALCDVLCDPDHVQGYYKQEYGFGGSLKGEAADAVLRLPRSTSAACTAALRAFLGNDRFVDNAHDRASAARALWQLTGDTDEAVAAIRKTLEHRSERDASGVEHASVHTGYFIVFDTLFEIGRPAAATAPLLTEMLCHWSVRNNQEITEHIKGTLRAIGAPAAASAEEQDQRVMNTQRRGLGPITGPADYRKATEEMEALTFRAERRTDEEEEYLGGLLKIVQAFDNFGYGRASARPFKMFQYLFRFGRKGTIEEIEGSTGIQNLTAFFHGDRELSEDDARKLGEFFGVNPNVFSEAGATHRQ